MRNIGGRKAERGVLVGVLSMAVAIALAGCANPTVVPTASPSSSAISTPPGIATSTPTALPSAPPTSTASPGTQVTTACTTIFTAQQVYDFNPNYVANAAYTPPPGSLVAQAVADLGKACGWIDETSSQQLAIAVALPSASNYSAQEAAAKANGGLSSYNGDDSVNFQSSGGVGTLQVFAHGNWLIISSVDFATAGDAEPIAKTVLGNLGLH